MGYMRSMPKTQVKTLNMSRYKRMLKTAAQLTDLLRKYVAEGEIEIGVDPTYNLGTITAELDSFSVDEPIEFSNIVSEADNFEIYPLNNGKIRLDITFQSVLRTIK